MNENLISQNFIQGLDYLKRVAKIRKHDTSIHYFVKK